MEDLMSNNDSPYRLTIRNSQGDSWTYTVQSLAEAKRLMAAEFADTRNISANINSTYTINSISALKRTK